MLDQKLQASNISTGSAGTDIIQISDIAAQKNKYDLALNGGRGLYIDNRSNSFILLTFQYGTNVGFFYEVLGPWEDTNLTLESSTASLTLTNLNDTGNIPIGFVTIGSQPVNLHGYVLISALADQSLIQRNSRRKADPPFYQFAALTIPPNTQDFVIGNGRGGASVTPSLIQSVRIANFWNYDSTNPVRFCIFPGPDVASNISNGNPLGGPKNATGNDPFFKIGPNGFFSMDCDWGDFGAKETILVNVAAENPSLTASVSVGVMLRGY